MKTLLSVFLLCTFFSANGQERCPIIPTPTVYKVIQGEYDLSETLTIARNEMPQNVYDFLEKELEAQFSIALELGEKQSNLRFMKIRNVPEGSYSINVGNEVVVTYSSDESCLHAVISLLQMIHGEPELWMIRKSFVNDSPKFGWRGLHLDVSRHFFSVDEVKRFIDLMTFYKFNTFHWHLTDDQGWRIEIKKYPELTNIGAYRDSTVIGHYSDSPRRYEHQKYGGYYSQEEIKEVVAYAAQRYITVVPEIEMPGHSRAALAAYPEYSCTGKDHPVPGLWGIFDDIYCSKDESINFMKDILSEVLTLFPSEYIHIGGDEAPKTRWKTCKDCQKVIKKNGLKDEHELQSYFIRQIDQFLTEKGRKLIGWDEILEGGLSPNAAVMSWRGEKGGIEAAKQGHNVVMSPTTYCYFDYYQSGHSVEPLAIGGYLPLEKVYKFNPVPSDLTTEEARFILGGQANLWTEYIPDMKHLEYMTYPRALAIAQSLWCVKKPSYEHFLESYLAYHETFLERNNVNFSRSIHLPEMVIERTDLGINVGFAGATKSAEFNAEVSSWLIDEYYSGAVGSGDDNRVYIGREPNGNSKNYKFKISADMFEDTFMYSLKATADIGIPIELLTPPHPKYDHNGSLNLVDGIEGSIPWKGSEWLGFRESKIEMILDLESVKELKGVKIGFLDNNGSWIYLPKRVVVEASEDRASWRKVIRSHVEESTDDDGVFTCFFSAETQYLKITINTMELIPEGLDGGGNIPWTFIDEIELIYPEE